MPCMLVSLHMKQRSKKTTKRYVIEDGPCVQILLIKFWQACIELCFKATRLATTRG